MLEYIQIPINEKRKVILHPHVQEITHRIKFNRICILIITVIDGIIKRKCRLFIIENKSEKTVLIITVVIRIILHTHYINRISFNYIKTHRWCNYYKSILLKSLSQRVVE